MGAPGYGRYSPTYRGPDQMRRCMTNPSVSSCTKFSFLIIQLPVIPKNNTFLQISKQFQHNANPIADANTQMPKEIFKVKLQIKFERKIQQTKKYLLLVFRVLLNN